MPLRAALIWLAVLAPIAAALAVAAGSPLLAYRQPVYIFAGLAGVLGLGLLLLQPLLAAGALPGLRGAAGRRAHRWAGGLLLASVLGHVAGLWLTSPPDLIDALLLRSPTLFSPFGVLAMWACLAAAALALLRRRLPPRRWRRAHALLGALLVLATLPHALLIDGTMGPVTKPLLCGLALAATGYALWRRRGF